MLTNWGKNRLDLKPWTIGMRYREWQWGALSIVGVLLVSAIMVEAVMVGGERVKKKEAEVKNVQAQAEEPVKKDVGLSIDRQRVITTDGVGDQEEITENDKVDPSNQAWKEAVVSITYLRKKVADYDRQGVSVEESQERIENVLNILWKGDYDQLDDEVSKIDEELERRMEEEMGGG
jgi:hypothetical protein